MSWLYHQASGCLESASGRIEGTGYSGYPPYVNQPTVEDLVAKGPIPAGYWKIVSLEEVTEKHGPYVLVLSPDEDTRARVLAMGRDPDSFRMHGESLKNPGFASEGCIIQPRITRELVWNSGDKLLEVTA